MIYSTGATTFWWCGAKMSPSKAIYISIGILGFGIYAYFCSERFKKEMKASKG